MHSSVEITPKKKREGKSNQRGQSGARNLIYIHTICVVTNSMSYPNIRTLLKRAGARNSNFLPL